MQQYNHRTIKLEPVNVNLSTYIDFGVENNEKDRKVGDYLRISKYRNIFAKGYAPNWSEEVFVIKKLKNTVQWACVIEDLNGEESVEAYFKKELQKTNQTEFRVEKVIKRKGDKLYVKWKGFDNSFNGWIDEKRHNINESIFS